MEWALQIYAFVWGAVWGSFLNVVIYRVPLDLSVVRPASRCGSCGVGIHWYDNVPILSYLLLRGKCRACGTEYSPRYMLVEAMCGLLCLQLMRATVLPLDAQTFEASLITWLWLQTFVYALVAITFIDLEHTFIPDEISFPLIAVGMVGGLMIPGVDGVAGVLGAAFGGTLLMLVVVIGSWLFRREAMGMGDVKLLALIGAFLGWQALPDVLFLGAVQGLLMTLFALAYSRLTGKDNSLTMTTQELDEKFEEEGLYADDKDRLAIPFGPFLSLAALEVLFFGHGWLFTLADAITRPLIGG